MRLHLIWRSGRDHMPAILARARTQVNKPVGRAHGVFVMFDHQHGIAHIAQAGQGADQALVIPLMQANRWLVQDIEHAGQLTADLGGQPDALGFAAAQSGRIARQGQIIQPDIAEEADPRAQLAQDLVGDLLFAPAEYGSLAAQRFHPAIQVIDGKLRNLVDGASAYGDRNRFGLEALPAAIATRDIAHVFLNLAANELGLGLAITPPQIGDDALVPRRPSALLPIGVIIGDIKARIARAIQDQVLVLLLELLPRHIQLKAEAARHAVEDIPVPAAPVIQPKAVCADGAFSDCLVGVGHDQVGVDLLTITQALAGWAGAAGRIEAEEARLRLGYAAMTIGASQVFAVQVIDGIIAVADILDNDAPFAQLERRLHRVGQARLESFGVFVLLSRVLAHDEAVHHHLDIVNDIAVQLNIFIQIPHRAINTHARETLRSDICQRLLVIAFLAVDHGGEHLDAAAGGHILHLVDDLLRALRRHFRAANGTMGDAHASEKQAQIIVDLGHCAHGRARIVADALLVDRDSRAQAFDLVDIRLLHQAQELARIAAQALDIAALALGEDGVKRQRRLARAGQTRDDHQPVARYLDIDVLEIVLARAADDYLVLQHASAA